MSNLKTETINGITLPKRIIESLNESSDYFGDAFKDMIITSISKNLEDQPKENLRLLEESINTASLKNEKLIYGKAILENIIAPESFITKLKSVNPDYMSGFGEIIEADGGASGTERESIEGDGDVPDEEQPEQPQTEEQPEQPEQPQLTPEQTLQLELNQTDSKFVTIVLYDKIVDLMGSIKTIKENMSSSKSEMELDLYTTLEKYESYLEILNELIFVMDINTIYYNLVNITIEVNALLNKYLISTKVKTINDKSSTEEEREEAIKDLKINNQNDGDTSDEMEDIDNKNLDVD